MSSSGTSPFSLPFSPAEPGYEYESVLPLKVQVDPRTGQRVPGTVPSLAVPGFIRGAVNDLALTVQAPGAVARGQVPQAQLPALASTMTGTLMGAGMGADTLVGEASPEVLGSFRGYHGTPYTFAPVEDNPFGKFENQAIGSGEGAQVYGWGHYVAGAKATAEEYQRNLSGSKDPIVTFQGEPLNWGHIPELDDEELPAETLAKKKVLMNQGDPRKAWSDLNTDAKWYSANKDAFGSGGKAAAYSDARNWLGANLAHFALKEPAGGSLYHVEIKPDESELLDWDGPLTDKQSQQLESTLGPETKPSDIDIGQSNYDSVSSKRGLVGWRDVTGEDVYKFLVSKGGSATAASEALHNAGVPGIKYLDQFSRGKVGTADDIRLNRNPDGTFELRAYTSSAAQAAADKAGKIVPRKFTTDSIHGNLTEQEVRQYVGQRVGDDLLNQIANYRHGGLQARATSSGPVAFKGTSNYVIFHPDNLRIVGRNGQEVPQQLQEIDHDPFAASGALSGDDGE